MSKTQQEIRIAAYEDRIKELEEEVKGLEEKIKDSIWRRRSRRKKVIGIKAEIEDIKKKVEDLKGKTDDDVMPLDLGKKAIKYAINDAKYETNQAEIASLEAKKSELQAKVDDPNTLEPIKRKLSKRIADYDEKIADLKKKAAKIEGKQRRIALKKIKKERPYDSKVSRAQGFYDNKNALYEQNKELANQLRDGTLKGAIQSFKCDIRGIFYKRSRDKAYNTLEKMKAKQVYWEKARVMKILNAKKSFEELAALLGGGNSTGAPRNDTPTGNNRTPVDNPGDGGESHTESPVVEDYTGARRWL